MTGHICEEQLALYAFGDVAGRERATIAGHVKCCRECAKVLEEFRHSQCFMAAALKDPERADLLKVRAVLAAKLQRSDGTARRPAWWLAGAVAAAALALLVPAVQVGHRRAPIRNAEAVAAQQMSGKPAKGLAVKVAALPRMVARVSRSHGRGAGLREVTLMAGAQQPATIKMATADPNVVILWQMNEGEKDQ